MFKSYAPVSISIQRVILNTLKDDFTGDFSLIELPRISFYREFFGSKTSLDLERNINELSKNSFFQILDLNLYL